MINKRKLIKISADKKREMSRLARKCLKYNLCRSGIGEAAHLPDNGVIEISEHASAMKCAFEAAHGGKVAFK